jgi:hypothetical protein
VQIPAGNRLSIVACGGTYAYADGVLTLAVRTEFAGGRTFEYEVPCRRAEAETAPGTGVFPVEYTVYGADGTLEGYRVEADENGDTRIALRGKSLIFFKDADGNDAVPLTLVVQAGGEERECAPDSFTLLGSGTIESLATTPIDNEMIFVLEGSVVPETIAVRNGETGETIVSFRAEDEPQLVPEAER